MRAVVWLLGVLFVVACDNHQRTSPGQAASATPVPEAPVSAGLIFHAPQPSASAFPPQLPPSADGHGWYCIKNTSVENMSTCWRTAESCAHGRQVINQALQPYGPCFAQARATCFTFHDVLQGTDRFDCSATLEACSHQRAYSVAQTKDVTNVSDCGGFD